MESYIRFDWAMKRLLRNKANYAVLEGLLTTLLEEKVTIQKLLESESNQEDEFDKYNRVDMLAENSKENWCSSRFRTIMSMRISSGCCLALRSW